MVQVGQAVCRVDCAGLTLSYDFPLTYQTTMRSLYSMTTMNKVKVKFTLTGKAPARGIPTSGWISLNGPEQTDKSKFCLLTEEQAAELVAEFTAQWVSQFGRCPYTFETIPA